MDLWELKDKYLGRDMISDLDSTEEDVLNALDLNRWIYDRGREEVPFVLLLSLSRQFMLHRMECNCPLTRDFYEEFENWLINL